MKNKRLIKITVGVAILAVVTYISWDKSSEQKKLTLVTTNSVPHINISGDEALLSIVKNDYNSFNEYIVAGGSLDASLPTVDGKTMTVAEGIVFHGRTKFIKELQSKKIAFVKQDMSKDFDVVSLAVTTNNTEALKLLIKEKPKLDRFYGDNGTTLLHMASAQCSPKIVQMLHENGLKWDTKAKDGSTALTVAAENSCLPVLSYFKGMGANLRLVDGRGKSALEIVSSKKDAASVAFTKSLLPATKKSANLELSDDEESPNFYKKKRLAKFRLADKVHTYEPEDRPDGSYQTADFAEFSD